jgi:capsular exopolysaccharide synthesis family protein
MGFFENIKKRRREKDANKNKSNRKDYLLNADTPFDVTEAFRNLKATLSVSMPAKEGGAVIAITSSYPEDGKTTVTTNLSLMFAMSDAKVVVLDADIRKGRVAKFFKRKSSPGLSDYLSGLVSLEDVLHSSHVNDNLYFIACGTHSPKPYELLESEKMTALLDELRTKFDYIVIDTPPVLMVSDALAVAPKTDGTVLTCRHNVSFVSDVQRSLSTLQFAKANVLGVVVNDYHAPQGKLYSNYRGYYHYSKYAYNYEYTRDEDDLDEDEKANQAEQTKDTTAEN